MHHDKFNHEVFLWISLTDNNIQTIILNQYGWHFLSFFSFNLCLSPRHGNKLFKYTSYYDNKLQKLIVIKIE